MERSACPETTGWGAQDAIKQKGNDVWDYVVRFLTTVPEFLGEFWEFAGGLEAVAIAGVSAVLAAGFGLAALRMREGHGWLSSIFGVLAGAIAFWWVNAIIPSASVYFIDEVRDEYEGILLPGPLPGMDNAYGVFRDVFISGQMILGIVVFVVAALLIQKRYPRTLAEGEEARAQSGGYK